MMRWDFWRRERRETDLEDEIAYDLALDAEERIRSGITRQEAERASRRDFGNVLLLKEGIREMWGWTSLERLGHDLRYGWRTLRKNPLFATMAVLSPALGIHGYFQLHGCDSDARAAGMASRRSGHPELAYKGPSWCRPRYERELV